MQDEKKDEITRDFEFIPVPVFELGRFFPKLYQQILSYFVKHKNQPVYPAEITDYLRNGNDNKYTIQGILDAFKVLEEESLLETVELKEVVKPKNVSNYYKLTPKGVLMGGILARANGVTENELIENIKLGLKEYDVKEDVIQKFLELREKVLQKVM